MTEVSDSVRKGVSYVDNQRYGNAINLIEELTNTGDHKSSIEVAKYLFKNRGTPADIGVLIKACRRSDHDTRAREYPKVLGLFESWRKSDSYEYRVPTIASLLTLLRLVDERAEFWKIFEKELEERDKTENEFILSEYAQMLRQENRDRFVQEWINIFNRLPKRLQENDLLRKLYAQALLDQGTVPLEEIKALLLNTRDEKFKKDLLKRIEELKSRRGTLPSSSPRDDEERSAIQRGEQNVFISYSHSDKKYADEIANILNDLGVNYFLDRKDIDWGSSIAQEIHKGLSNCTAIVVIVSPGSLKSQWVPFEIGKASGERKRILPFLVHPDLDVPEYIRGLKYTTNFEDVRKYFEQIVNTAEE